MLTDAEKSDFNVSEEGNVRTGKGDEEGPLQSQIENSGCNTSQRSCCKFSDT